MPATRPKARVFTAAAVLLACISGLGVASAFGSQGISVPEPNAQVYDIALAVAPSGAATAVWVAAPFGARSEVRVLQIDASGKAGPVTTLSDPSYPADTDVDVGVNRRGVATIAWDGAGGVVETQIKRNGQARPIRAVGRGDQPRVEVEDSGTPIVAWKGDRGIVATGLDARGMPGRPRLLLEAKVVDSYDLAFDRRGWATVAAVTGYPSPRIEIARTSSGLARATVLARRNAGNYVGGRTPALALDSNARGNATIAWSEVSRGSRSVVALEVSPTGKPSRTRELSNGGKRFVIDPDVYVAPGGAATVAWSSRRGGEDNYRKNRVVISRIGKRGKPSRARPVTPPEDARRPVLVPDRRGGVHVAWRADRKRKGKPGFTRIAERRVVGRHKHKVHRFFGSAPASNGPELALDHDGGLTLAWVGDGIDAGPGTGIEVRQRGSG